MKNKTPTTPVSTSSPTGTHARTPWKVALVVVGALAALTLVAVGGYAGYLKVSGTPFIDEWVCSDGEAPVTMAEGGSYCETEGATLPAGHTWHPLGNRPLECEDRWGWERAYTTWATDDAQDPGFEIGCVRRDTALPDGWNLVPESAEGDFVPEGANPTYVG